MLLTPIITRLQDIPTRAHASLTSLSADDHTQYALLAGRSGGQTLIGDTASGGNLLLQSTAHATLGYVGVVGAPRATANYGLFSLGNGPFDGSTSGKFVGNAAGTVLAANITGSAVLIDMQVSGASKFNVSNAGNIGWAGQATGWGTFRFGNSVLTYSSGIVDGNGASPCQIVFRGASSANQGTNEVIQVTDISNVRLFKLSPFVCTSGTPTPSIWLSAPAHTGITASTEQNDVYLGLARTVQFATGAITTQRAVFIDKPTYAFVGASTISDAATLAVAGAPVAGTNATITRPWALWVQAGAARFGGNITLDDAANIIGNATTGHQIMTATSQKLGLWGATPVIQQASADQAAITDSTTGTPAASCVDVGVVFSQSAINSNFATILRLLNRLRLDAVTIGSIKGAA